MPPLSPVSHLGVETVEYGMATIDPDKMMVIAGVLLSALAFVDIYATWKKTRRTERSEDDPAVTGGTGEQSQNPPASDG